MKKQSFNNLLNLKLEYFDKSNSVELIDVIETDINNISSISDENLIFVLTQIFNIIGGLVGLLLINFKLTVFVVLFIPLNYLITTYLSKRNNKITSKNDIKFSRLFEKFWRYNKWS